MTATTAGPEAAPQAPARPVMANPAPWAVTAFGTTSFMIGMFQTGILNSAGMPIVLPAAFIFGGLVQMIVAVMEFSRGNMFGGAVFGTYGPFWIMLGLFNTIYVGGVPVAQLGAANGLFIAVFAVVSFYLSVASLRTDLVLTSIMWLIFVGLSLLAAGAWSGVGGITKVGGVVVLIFAILAWYHAAGDIIESTFGRKVLPFGPAPIR